MTDVWPLFGSLAHVLREILAHAARGTRSRGTNITSGQQRPKTGRYIHQAPCFHTVLYSQIQVGPDEYLLPSLRGVLTYLVFLF